MTDSLAASCQSPVLETSSSTSIAGEAPRIFLGAKKRNSPVSIITFGQKKRAYQLLTSSEVVTPSHEVEVRLLILEFAEILIMFAVLL